MNARQHPRSAEALAALGWAQFCSGRSDQAAGLLEAAVTNGGANAESLYHFAQVLSETGGTDRAEHIVASLLQSNVTFPQRAEAERLTSAADTEPAADMN
jgi:Flp pilus assembly protein TadD